MNLQELFNLINENIKQTDKKNINHLYNIIKDYNGTDWKQYRKVNKETYNKILVNSNENFDMYIITWNNYQKSKIHNHPENGCIYKILEGHLIEENYDDKLTLVGIKSLFIDRIGYIDDFIHLHRMNNYKNNISVSLHIYSPSNFKTTYYDDND